jgi:hypothetical protein
VIGERKIGNEERNRKERDKRKKGDTYPDISGPLRSVLRESVSSVVNKQLRTAQIDTRQLLMCLLFVVLAARIDIH